MAAKKTKRRAKKLVLKEKDHLEAIRNMFKGQVGGIQIISNRLTPPPKPTLEKIDKELIYKLAFGNSKLGEAELLGSLFETKEPSAATGTKKETTPWFWVFAIIAVAVLANILRYNKLL